MSLRKSQWDGGGGKSTSAGQGTPAGQAATPGLSGGSAGAIESRTGGEALRDIDQQARSDVKFMLLPVIEAIYSEPFYLALETEPKGGILCIRCIDSVSDKPVTCGVGVHFVWEPDGGRAKITSIDGLSSGAGGGVKKYKFTFLAVG